MAHILSVVDAKATEYTIVARKLFSVSLSFVFSFLFFTASFSGRYSVYCLIICCIYLFDFFSLSNNLRLKIPQYQKGSQTNVPHPLFSSLLFFFIFFYTILHSASMLIIISWRSLVIFCYGIATTSSLNPNCLFSFPRLFSSVLFINVTQYWVQIYCYQTTPSN